jgi:hypothetical protein
MEGQVIRRRRPAKSCVECRRRKIRCDRNDPCSHCVSGKSRCTYKAFRTESLNNQRSSLYSLEPRSIPVETSQQISEDRSQDDNLRSPVHLPSPHTIRANSGAAPTISPTTGPRRDQRSDPANSAIGEDLFQRLQTLEQFSIPDSDHGQPGTPRELVAHQVGLQASQLVLMKSRVMRWSHLIFMAKEVSL